MCRYKWMDIKSDGIVANYAKCEWIGAANVNFMYQMHAQTIVQAMEFELMEYVQRMLMQMGFVVTKLFCFVCVWLFDVIILFNLTDFNTHAHYCGRHLSLITESRKHYR